jgi:hypothetical protein
MRRAILVGATSAAIALGSVIFASPASAKDCPPGTVATRFEGVCTAGQGGASQLPIVAPAPASAGGPTISSIPGSGITTVDGVPCTLAHQGFCRGVMQNGG